MAFSRVANKQTIQASHVNELQAAVEALEGDTGAGAGATVSFGDDGTITTTPDGGVGATVTVSFPADGSIVETFGPPISQVRTTTFNDDGSFTVVVS